MNAKSTAINLFTERKNLENNGRLTRSNNIFSAQNVKKKSNTVETVEIAHKAFQPMLYLAQCIGILPIYGISGVNSKRIRFRWISGRIVISIIMIFFGLVLLILTAAHQGFSSKSVGAIVFYFVATLSMCFYIQLAREWKALITEWKKVIDLMEIDGKQIIQITKIVTITMTVLSLCEHILANLYTYFIQKNTQGDQLKEFFIHKFKNVFYLVEYSFWKAIVVLIIHFQNTIVWNFTDIFIMNVAIIMSLMFKYFYNDVCDMVKQEKPISSWKQKRELYCQLSKLMKTIDNKIANVVLLSFGSNLFFICKQLYHSLTSMQSFHKNIYFYISLGFILLRTCGVCFTAANIYEYSKKPVHVLYTISSEHYNIEVQRLFDTINSETLALSGYNFFTLNRKLLLTVAGTIATYEIVLVQFKALNADE